MFLNNAGADNQDRNAAANKPIISLHHHRKFDIHYHIEVI
jgi:hypothetical protein